MTRDRLSRWQHPPEGHIAARDASRIAEVATVTIYNWIRAGFLPAQKENSSGRLWIKEADLHERLKIIREARAERYANRRFLSKKRRGRKSVFTPEQKRVLERMIKEALANHFRAIIRKL